MKLQMTVGNREVYTLGQTNWVMEYRGEMRTALIPNISQVQNLENRGEILSFKSPVFVALEDIAEMLQLIDQWTFGEKGTVGALWQEGWHY